MVSRFLLSPSILYIEYDAELRIRLCILTPLRVRLGCKIEILGGQTRRRDSMGKMHKKAGVLDLVPYPEFVHCGGKFTLFAGEYYAVADETADWNEVSWASLEGKFPEGV